VDPPQVADNCGSWNFAGRRASGILGGMRTPVSGPKLLLRMALLAHLGTQALAGGKPAWQEVRSPHFIAYTDANLSDAREALREFEEIRRAFESTFPGIRVDPPRTLVVFIHRDEASMKQLLPEEFSGKRPKRSSGWYLWRPDQNYALLRLDARTSEDQPYHVLYHEFTHGILHQNFAAIPVWLDEGLAEYYGETRILRSNRVQLGRASRASLETLRQSSLLPLETLLTVDHKSPEYREGDKAGVFYAQSWALVHYLLMDEKAKKAGLFQKYLQALSQDPDPIAVARKAWGDLAAVQSSLYAYTQQGRFHFWDLPLGPQTAVAEFPSRPLSEAESLVARGEFLRDKGQSAEARALLQQALALDPKLAAARVALAVEQFRAADMAGARENLERAEALGSQDARTPLLLAEIALARNDLSPAERQKVAAWLETARSRRPEDPEVHMQLCRFHASDPGSRQQALLAGRKALELDPDDPSHWANFGYVCMVLGEEQAAKAVGDRIRSQVGRPGWDEAHANYQPSLERFLESRQRLASPPPASVTPPEGKGASLPATPKPRLKFSLPDHLAPVGLQVMQLSGQGQEPEAIPVVEEALAAAKSEIDRKALRGLLKLLRERNPASAR
jgi:tetratricopeptide (TPR) repeat protein